MYKVYLVGFMGSGKSAIGRRLSYLLKMPYYDMDKEIVKYRMHNTSLSNEGTSVLFKKSQAITYLKYRFKSHLHKEPRQALFCFLSLKRFTLNSSFFSWLLSIYELLEKSYCIITHSKPIDKSYKHYFNPNI